MLSGMIYLAMEYLWYGLSYRRGANVCLFNLIDNARVLMYGTDNMTIHAFFVSDYIIKEEFF